TAGDVNGDGYADVIIGAKFYNDGFSNQGHAWIYAGSPTGLSHAPLWDVSGAPPQTDGGEFGTAVATAGDVNGDGYADVVVGAPHQGNGGGDTDEGLAYVYEGSPAGLAVSPAWTGDVNEPGAHFGFSAASAGDVNGDGFGDVIVG